jgi:hypothetical protein
VTEEAPQINTRWKVGGRTIGIVGWVPEEARLHVEERIDRCLEAGTTEGMIRGVRGSELTGVVVWWQELKL